MARGWGAKEGVLVAEGVGWSGEAVTSVWGLVQVAGGWDAGERASVSEVGVWGAREGGLGSWRESEGCKGGGEGCKGAGIGCRGGGFICKGPGL